MDEDFTLYLTHSAEDENWQMVCTDVGRYLTRPGSPYPPEQAHHPEGFHPVAVGRRLNEYQMVYLLSGKGSLEVGGRQYPLETGSLFLLFPGVLHSYRPDPATGWTECWVGFRGPQIDALQATGVISPTTPVFQPGYQASLVGLFQAIFQLVRVQEPLFQFKVCSEILRMLAETLSLARLAAQPTRAQEIVEKAKAFIAASIGGVFDLARLGEELRISQAQLNEVFKQYTGMTPYQYCIHAKINRAKEILTVGEVSVKEIAWQVGFDDQYYFSRLFKKKTGFSPSQWMARR